MTVPSLGFVINIINTMKYLLNYLSNSKFWNKLGELDKPIAN